MDEVVTETGMRIVNVNYAVLPSEIAGNVRITAVLVQDGGGYYRVYEGEGKDTWVAEHGLKCSYAQALKHFPNLREEDMA